MIIEIKYGLEWNKMVKWNVVIFVCIKFCSNAYVRPKVKFVRYLSQWYDTSVYNKIATLSNYRF